MERLETGQGRRRVEKAEVRRPSTVEERLKLDYYDAVECAAAIRAETLPFSLGHPVTRNYVIRGIRYNRDGGFGTELHGLSGAEEITRALNARKIMSNAIPEIKSPTEYPYCIWHPDFATEETYR
jgi:hypothetical protein